MRGWIRLLLAAVPACGGGSEAGTPTAAAEAPAVAAGGEETTLGLPNERHVEGRIVTGGQPDEATLRRAAERGVTTVISLRRPGKPGYDHDAERAPVESRGMRFVSIPVPGPGGVTEENARALSEALSSAEDDVVLHCGTGNRAGAMLALHAFHVEGRSAEEAIAAGRAAGLTGLEDTVRAHFQTGCAEHPDTATC